MCFFHLNPIPRNCFSCLFDSYLTATIFVVGKSPGSPCSSNVWTCCCCCSPPGQLGNMCLSPTSNKLHQFPGNFWVLLQTAFLRLQTALHQACTQPRDEGGWGTRPLPRCRDLGGNAAGRGPDPLVPVSPSLIYRLRCPLSCEPRAVPLPPPHPAPSHPKLPPEKEGPRLSGTVPARAPARSCSGGGAPCRAHPGSPRSSLSFSTSVDQNVFTVPLCPRFLEVLPFTAELLSLSVLQLFLMCCLQLHLMPPCLSWVLSVANSAF